MHITSINQGDRMKDTIAPRKDEKSGTLATGDSYGEALLVNMGKSQIALSGTWTANVNLQFSPNPSAGAPTYFDLATYSSNLCAMVEVGFAGGLRFGIKAGEHTSGTVGWWIGQGL